MELTTFPCLDSSRTFPVNPFRGELRRSRGALLAVILLIVAMAWSAPAAGAQAVNFGSINVCPSGATTPAPCSKTLPLTFNIPAGTTIGTISYLTLGAQNLDFKAKANDTSTGLCSAQTYSSATTCTVDVTFAPVAPGQRKGAVQIVDGSGNVLANNYIYGTGVGPAIAFDPVTPIAPPSGFNNPQVVDGAGDVFFIDGATDTVDEILAVDGSIPANPTIRSLASFDYPSDVAVDGSGNVFVADPFFGWVYEILAVNGSIPANPTINSVVRSYPKYLALDGSGDVFYLEGGDSAVQEILAVNGSIPANPTIIQTGGDFIDPTSITVDGAGDVYVTDAGVPGGVEEILAVNGSIPANPTIDVLLDAGGCGQVAVDGSGNVFAACESSSVFELPRSQPPLLNFGPTEVGQTSSDSPQLLTIQNVGNALLSLRGLSVSENFTLGSGSGNCVASTTLVPGAKCSLSISFKPEAEGPLTGSVTLTDNALNGNPATQSIPVMGGVEPRAQVLTTSMEFGIIWFGLSPETLPLTIQNVGGGTLTIAPSINGPSYKIASSTCGAVSAGKSCTLQVEFAPVAVGGHGDILTLETNGSVNPTVALHGIGSGVGTKMETPLEFGTISFGSTKTLLLTIKNIPGPGEVGPATIGTKINGPSYKILTNSQNTCLAGVDVRQSCTLPVEFDPVAVGNHDDVLTLTPTGSVYVTPSTVYLHGIAD